MNDQFFSTTGASAPEPGDAPGVLTYEPYFGLKEKPFSLSADPRFLFKSPAHAKALDALLTGIRRREGLIALTGEIGAGKTTLCRAALQQLNRRTFASFIPDPFVSREDLLTMLLVDFGVISIDDLKRGRLKGASRPELSYALYDFLDSLSPLQAFAVLVIDEAQNLPAPLLDEIRILSELERREKLLQVVLVGQPELRANLKRPDMRQVDQRVTVRLQLAPLDAVEVAGYVTHRLAVAGDGAPLVEFLPAALREVHRGSGGIPRLINRICDRALELAYAARTSTIDDVCVRAAIEEVAPADTGAFGRPAFDVATGGALAEFAPEALASSRSGPVPAAWLSPAFAASTRQDPTPAVPPPPAPADSVRVDAEPAVPAAASPTEDRREPTPAPEPTPSPAPTPAVSVRPPAPAAAAAPPGFATGTWRQPQPRRSARVPIGAALAASLALTAGIPGWSWYQRARSIDAGALMALLPPSPPRPAHDPARVPPSAGLTAVTKAPPASAAPVAPAVRPVSSGAGEYAIQVGSFMAAEHAELLVADLANAGHRARIVEVALPPPRGRMFRVVVGGYSSAIAVERDLRQIRELPGGSDARLLER